MKTFKNIFLNHTILTIYLVVFIFLCFGVFATSGVVYLPMLLCFLMPLFLFYFLGNNIVAKIGTGKSYNLNFFGSYKLLLPLIVFLFVGHIISMSGLPAFECYEITHLSEAVELRRGITTRAHPIWNYISSINIKALIPFSLVLFWHKKQKKLFWGLIIIGCLYSFTLMQKSYIFSVLIPVVTISIYEKKWIVYYGTELTKIEMSRMYSGADVYVSPYRAEAFNIPIFEAIASGLLVIVTDYHDEVNQVSSPTHKWLDDSFAMKVRSDLIRLTSYGNPYSYCFEPDEVNVKFSFIPKLTFPTSLR